MQVLQKLLVIVIGMLKSPHEATRRKILEILSHVNKRIKGQMAIKLPLAELQAMFLDSASPPMTRNFALVYCEMAFERAEAADRLQTVRRLFASPIF